MNSKKNTILISGASRGIGAGIADFFLANNWQVFAPGSAEMDVTSEHSVSLYLEQVTSLDLLVVNAGIFHSDSFKKYSFDDWRRVMDVNLDGAFRTIQAALPKLLASESKLKSIVIISSVSAHGEPGASAYAASKAALIALGKSLAQEFAADGIRVNMIAPGWVRTDMAKNILHDREKEEMALASTLFKSYVEPAEIAEAVNYLHHAASLTGQVLEIDQGLCL